MLPPPLKGHSLLAEVEARAQPLPSPSWRPHSPPTPGALPPLQHPGRPSVTWEARHLGLWLSCHLLLCARPSGLRLPEGLIATASLVQPPDSGTRTRNRVGTPSPRKSGGRDEASDTARTGLRVGTGAARGAASAPSALRPPTSPQGLLGLLAGAGWLLLPGHRGWWEPPAPGEVLATCGLKLCRHCPQGAQDVASSTGAEEPRRPGPLRALALRVLPRPSQWQSAVRACLALPADKSCGTSLVLPAGLCLRLLDAHKPQKPRPRLVAAAAVGSAPGAAEPRPSRRCAATQLPTPTPWRQQPPLLGAPRVYFLRCWGWRPGWRPVRLNVTPAVLVVDGGVSSLWLGVPGWVMVSSLL